MINFMMTNCFSTSIHYISRPYIDNGDDFRNAGQSYPVFRFSGGTRYTLQSNELVEEIAFHFSDYFPYERNWRGELNVRSTRCYGQFKLTKKGLIQL